MRKELCAKDKFIPNVAPWFSSVYIQAETERERERRTRSRGEYVGTMALIDATIFVSTELTKSRSIYLGWSGSYVYIRIPTLSPGSTYTRDEGIRFFFPPKNPKVFALWGTSGEANDRARSSDSEARRALTSLVGSHASRFLKLLNKSHARDMPIPRKY